MQKLVNLGLQVQTKLHNQNRVVLVSTTGCYGWTYLGPHFGVHSQN